MAGIDVEKLLKHLKKALDFLQKIPTLESPLHEWSKKELIELLTKDMVDFEMVVKAPMSHLNEGGPDTDPDNDPGQPKKGLRRSHSKPFNFNKRLFKGELTIEIGENGEVIIRQGGGGTEGTGKDKSQKPPEPEPEVDFGEDDDLYDDTATVPEEQEKQPVEKPKNIGAKFGSFLKSKAKVLSPLPDRKRAVYSGKLLVKIGMLSKPTTKHCAIKQGSLYYGSAENTPSEGKIRLQGCSITPLEGKGAYSFELTSMDGDNYLLSAESAEDRENWIKQLKEARDTSGKDRSDSDSKLLSSLDKATSAPARGRGATTFKESLPEPEPIIVEPEPEPEPEPESFDQSVSALGNALEDALADEGEGVCEKRGWLKRVGNLSSHKVWVVVSGPQLTIYRDDKEQDVKEEYSIYGAKISTKGPNIKVTMTDIKKGVALSPIYKSSLPDAKWLQVFAKAIQAEEDIYEEYISPDTLGADASSKKGIGTSFRQTMKVGFSMFSRSEEVQGNPTHAGTLWYQEPKTDRYLQNYFTVVGDFLVHYRSKGDTQVLGRINLSKCYGMWLGPYGPMKNVLCLSHDGKKIHYFSILNLDDVEDWLDALGKTLVDSTWCTHYDDVTNQEVAPGVSVKQVYQAIYSHKAETSDELALDQGDMVHVREFSGNAWLCEKLNKAMGLSGKAGYVTGAYLAASYAAY